MRSNQKPLPGAAAGVYSAPIHDSVSTKDRNVGDSGGDDVEATTTIARRGNDVILRALCRLVKVGAFRRRPKGQINTLLVE